MRFTTRQRRMPAVMIINLVDILAILVIFLVVTTTFKKDQPEVVINLPESKTAVTQPGKASEATVLVEIQPDGTVSLDGKPFAENEDDKGKWSQKLSEQIVRLTKSGRSFAVKADDKAGFGKVVMVLDAFQLSGVKSLPAFTKAPAADGPK